MQWWDFEPDPAEDGVKIHSKPYGRPVTVNTPGGDQTFQFLNLIDKWHVAAPGSDLGTDAAAEQQ